MSGAYWEYMKFHSKRITFQNVWRQSSGELYLNFDVKRSEKYSFSYIHI